MNRKLLFVVNVDWSFLSHRLPIALQAQKAGFDVHIATVITNKLHILESNGITVHPIGLVRGGWGIFNAIGTFFNLCLIIRQIKPDLIHLVTIKPVLLGGLVARLMRVPALISAVSGLGYVFMSEGVIAWARRKFVIYLYSFALGHHNQVVIFQNSDDRDTVMLATGLPGSKVEMIRGSGVDLVKYAPVPEPSGVPVVLFPARLLADKGIFEFIAAARLLRAKGAAARFVLAGFIDSANPTCVSQPQLDAWVEEGVVEYWGYRTDMPNVLANVAIVVLPSYREGLPKVLLEAAACGKPIVTTDVPGCRNAIEPNLTGLLVAMREVEGLAQAIERLLTNPKLREKMGLAARRLAEQEFDDRIVANMHLDIYQKLLAKQGSQTKYL